MYASQKRRQVPRSTTLSASASSMEDLNRAGDLTIKYASSLSNRRIVDRAEASERAV